MCTLLCIASSVARHRELSQATLYLMGHLGCKGYLAVDIATQADSYQLIWIRGKILTGDAAAVAFVTVANNCRVNIQRAAVVLNLAQT